MGGLYEVSDGAAVKKYYSISGMTVGISDGGVMKYPLTDHLGSVVAVTDASGALLSQQRYLPFGQERADLGPITQTDFGYTGQRNIADIGLMDYHARMYDALLGRFVQPDTIIPSMANPQGLDRFSYGLNNPIKYIDPNGRSSCVGSHYDDGPECAKREGSQLNLEIKQKKYQDECARGAHRCNELPIFAFTHIVWPGPVWSFASDAAMSIWGPPPSPLERLTSASQIPLGFRSNAEYQQFSSQLYSGLRFAGYNDTTAIFQGSAVTGTKYTTGQAFDDGRVSDYDIALSSEDMLAKAKDLGIGLRSEGTRTGPLSSSDLEKMGLSDLAEDLGQAAGRPVNFMIYGSVEDAMARAPSIMAPDDDIIGLWGEEEP